MHDGPSLFTSGPSEKRFLPATALPWVVQNREVTVMGRTQGQDRKTESSSIHHPALACPAPLSKMIVALSNDRAGGSCQGRDETQWTTVKSSSKLLKLLER